MTEFNPVELRGEYASLVPLSAEHQDELSLACADGQLFRLWYTDVPSPETMVANIAMRLERQAQGSMLPFTVLDADGVPVGMTTFTNIDRDTPRVEIGYTWYARRVQRTALNSQCKLLLLKHAFDTLGCVAVEFRTSSFNRASRRAIERLGAQLDGVLRSHRYHPNGVMRDTCVYSIIAGEWPGVRAQLEAVLDDADAQRVPG
ncbi:MAG: GNAT family protein [Pseudomonadota bacterium]